MAKTFKKIALCALALCMSVAVLLGIGTINVSADEAVKFDGAYVTLSDGIAAKFKFEVPDGYTQATALFTLEGEETTEKTFEVESGIATIAYDGLNPAQIDKTISLALTLSGEEKTDIGGNTTFTVSGYLDTLLTADPSAFAEIKTQSQYIAMRTLAANLVNYSAKAKLFTEEEDTVSSLLKTETVKNYVGTAVPTSDDKEVGEIADGSEYGFIGAKLLLGEKVNVAFSFVAKEAGVKVEVTLGGNATTVEATEDTSVTINGGLKAYSAVYRGLSVTELGETMTAKLVKNGEYIGNTVKYSVASYVYAMQSNNDEAMKALANAVYNYGLSAEKYVAAINASIGERIETSDYESQNATSLLKRGWTGEFGGYVYNAISYGEYIYAYTASGFVRFNPANSVTTGSDYETAGSVSGAIGADNTVISQSVAMFKCKGNVYVYSRTENAWYYRPLNNLFSSDWKAAQTMPVELGDSSKIVNVHYFEDTEKTAILTSDSKIILFDKNGNEEWTMSVDTITSGGKNRMGGGANGYLYYTSNKNNTENPTVTVINTNTKNTVTIQLNNAEYKSDSSVSGIFEFDGGLGYVTLSWGSSAKSYYQKVDFVSTPHKEAAELN